MLVMRGEDAQLEQLLKKLNNFGKNDLELINRADILDRELSKITPEDLFKQFTI
jgi:hypothetical protein